MLFFSKQTAVILLLHRVTPVRDAMWDPMDPALFEQALKYVQRRFHTIPLNQLLFDTPAVSSKPFAAITFDDGYSDFTEYSLPLLEKYKLPATMFVVTDCIDKNMPTWTFVLDYYFEKSSMLTLKELDCSAFPKAYQITTWHSASERIQYGKKIKHYLKWVPESIRSQAITAIIKGFCDVEFPGGMMMSWTDLQQVHAAGYGIGAHSVTHPTLATIEDDAALEYELKYSGERLREKIGIASEVFSYPCGSYDERVKQHTAKAGYKAGLAVDRKLYLKNEADMYAIPRIELYSESWQKVKMRMNGTMSFIEKIIK